MLSILDGKIVNFWKSTSQKENIRRIVGSQIQFSEDGANNKIKLTPSEAKENIDSAKQKATTKFVHQLDA